MAFENVAVNVVPACFKAMALGIQASVCVCVCLGWEAKSICSFVSCIQIRSTDAPEVYSQLSLLSSLCPPSHPSQVVTEQAESCMRKLLLHCPTPRLLPKLCHVCMEEKMGRLRHSAAEYIYQVLEEWEPSNYERHLDLLETAILSAAQDSQGETRVVGRNAFRAFSLNFPARGQAMLKRIPPTERALRDRLARVAAAEAAAPMAGSRSGSGGSSRAPSAGRHSPTRSLSGATLVRSASGSSANLQEAGRFSRSSPTSRGPSSPNERLSRPKSAATTPPRHGAATLKSLREQAQRELGAEESAGAHQKGAAGFGSAAALAATPRSMFAKPPRRIELGGGPANSARGQEVRDVGAKNDAAHPRSMKGMGGAVRVPTNGVRVRAKALCLNLHFFVDTMHLPATTPPTLSPPTPPVHFLSFFNVHPFANASRRARRTILPPPLHPTRFTTTRSH